MFFKTENVQDIIILSCINETYLFHLYTIILGVICFLLLLLQATPSNDATEASEEPTRLVRIKDRGNIFESVTLPECVITRVEES